MTIRNPKFVSVLSALPFCLFAVSSFAAGGDVYLNSSNINVSVGDGTSPGTFNNTFDGSQTINKVIDAPSADAEEFHNQTTHVWYSASANGGGLELEFDLLGAYNITTLHFWNYTAEGFDVDNIEFSFFNGDSSVGSLTIQPELGSSPGITAQDIILDAPLNVTSVVAFLTGSNRQVDFQNIGFTASNSSDNDNDGVQNDSDNCTFVSNADQRDTNGDGYGNACDPDLNNDGVVNFVDVGLWTPSFNTANDGDEDFNGDGAANFADYVLFSEYFLGAPGPSGLVP
ncbi:MAG: thrombospondin type 3 repeat-containing protein [Gammaproteobacteria bacterium]